MPKKPHKIPSNQSKNQDDVVRKRDAMDLAQLIYDIYMERKKTERAKPNKTTS